MDTMAKVETFNVKEGEQFKLAFQDEVIDAKWVVLKPPAKERALQITVLRRGV